MSRKSWWWRWQAWPSLSLLLWWRRRWHSSLSVLSNFNSSFWRFIIHWKHWRWKTVINLILLVLLRTTHLIICSWRNHQVNFIYVWLLLCTALRTLLLRNFNILAKYWVTIHFFYSLNTFFIRMKFNEAIAFRNSSKWISHNFCWYNWRVFFDKKIKQNFIIHISIKFVNK